MSADFKAFAVENARREFPRAAEILEPKILYCRSCLFMRDLSSQLEPDGSCKVCKQDAQEQR